MQKAMYWNYAQRILAKSNTELNQALNMTWYYDVIFNEVFIFLNEWIRNGWLVRFIARKYLFTPLK